MESGARADLTVVLLLGDGDCQVGQLFFEAHLGRRVLTLPPVEFLNQTV